MDSSRLICLNERSLEIFQDLSERIEHMTYASIIHYHANKIICSPNNDYNCWGKYYHNELKFVDCLLIKIAEYINSFKNGNGIIIWDDVDQSDHTSRGINLERKKHGIYNGISLIKKYSKDDYLILSFCSSEDIDVDSFHEKIILNNSKYFEYINNHLSES
jgi:hypothetical protein